MKIIRDGIEYELSEAELSTAYDEKRDSLDVEDICMHLEEYLTSEEIILLKDNDNFLCWAAVEFRRNVDKYDMQYEYAISKAIEDALRRFASEK